ncbi:uncharacterized protein [Halyomorpha halys]|nr:uncharacterized protein LOC106677676 isoform X4 [Halyomorpha halys]XP_014271250.1 uncharacterized protein LOC106677676 isoform X4 [Halyomorpha halys]
MATTNALHARRTSSYHWNHFIRLDFTKAKCRYCHRVIKMSRGSTGNLNRHIRLKHPSIVKNHSITMPPFSIPDYGPESPENIPGEVEVRIHEEENEKSESEGEDQSTSDRFVIQPNLNVTSVSQSSTTCQPPEKRQRMTFDIVRKGNSQQSKDEDEFSIMGKHIANKLRRLSPDVLPVVEKLITDVIFEAQCGNVSQTSRIAFYDMMNANLRNLQQANLTNNKVPPENDTPMKTENQSSMSPNIVFLLPQSDVSKTLPLNVQVVQAKAEVQNRNGEQNLQSDQQANQRMIIN